MTKKLIKNFNDLKNYNVNVQISLAKTENKQRPQIEEVRKKRGGEEKNRTFQAAPFRMPGFVLVNTYTRANDEMLRKMCA